MALSIRNPIAEKLAREVAKQSGESITQAIVHALEDRLERLRGRRTIVETKAEILRISKRCKSLPERDSRLTDEILDYNQIGVPR